MRFHSLALATLLAIAAIPARADYTTINYTGVVSAVYAPTFGPDGPSDIVVGTPVTFSFTYNPANLVTFAKTNFTDADGNPIVLHPAGATLYDDPGASYTITVGSHVWTQNDDDDGGYINENGIGPFPFIGYDGSPSQLIGFEGDAVNSEGLGFYSAPADDILGYGAPAGGYLAAPGDYGFDVTTSLDSTLDAIRAQGLAAAQVPEPSTWAILVLGGIGMAVSLRKRRPGRAPACAFA